MFVHWIRLRGFGYRQPGFYFVTLCAHERAWLFGEVVDGNMVLNRIGQVVYERIGRVPHHFARVRIDAFVVMPNHVHLLLVITEGDSVYRRGEASGGWAIREEEAKRDSDGVVVPGMADASPLHRPTGTASGSVGAIVQNLKSTATRKISRRRKTPGAPVWQRGYYDHVVRHPRALAFICAYIAENPARWAQDRLHPKR